MMLVGKDPATGATLRVTMSGGRIVEIARSPEPADVWLSAGLIDLQVNGFAGHDVNADDVTPDGIAAMTRALWRVGVTTVAPTIVTAPEAKIVNALSVIAAARAADPAIAHAIPFAHVEGPFIAADDGPRGVHDLSAVRPADVEELRRWQRASDGLVGIVTVSPHDDAGLEFIAAATRAGVRCAIGHTSASPENITRAADAGAVLSTHLGNGAHAVLPRHPNYIWSQLADDRIHAGFIADGHHLTPETFRAMLRAKGIEHAHLVSDATAIAGRPAGVYRTPVGGVVELSDDGRLSQRDTGRLAGAARSLADDVAIAAAMADLTLSDALALAATNPGRFVGGRGHLRPGADADLVTFRWTPGARALDVDTVIADGHRIVTAPE